MFLPDGWITGLFLSRENTPAAVGEGIEVIKTIATVDVIDYLFGEADKFPALK